MEKIFKFNEKEVEVLKETLNDAIETQKEFLDHYNGEDNKYFETEINELETLKDISRKIK